MVLGAPSALRNSCGTNGNRMITAASVPEQAFPLLRAGITTELQPKLAVSSSIALGKVQDIFGKKKKSGKRVWLRLKR